MFKVNKNKVKITDKQFLMWIGFVSIPLWCYLQHKLFQNTFHKVWTARNRTKKQEKYNFSNKITISFPLQLKLYFFLPFWLSLTLMLFVFPAVDTILLALDYFNSSVLIAMLADNSGTFRVSCGQVITKPIRRVQT